MPDSPAPTITTSRCSMGRSLLNCGSLLREMAYRPTERTRARAAAARERIVAAALDQLAEGGYASASMVAVARRAGVATGSVYRHFPSKGDLFAEAFRRASQREVDVLVEIGHRTMPVGERLAARGGGCLHPTRAGA